MYPLSIPTGDHLDAVSVLVNWLHPQSFSAKLLKHPADFSRVVAEMGIQVFVGKKKTGQNQQRAKTYFNGQRYPWSYVWKTTDRKLLWVSTRIWQVFIAPSWNLHMIHQPWRFQITFCADKPSVSTLGRDTKSKYTDPCEF
jgi:hypothetical protein